MNQTMTNVGIDPKDLDDYTYIEYCKLYLIERIYEVIPVTSAITYGNVATLIKCINENLFTKLNTETGKLILINKIYSLFMEAGNIEISREFLYNQVCHLSKYDPALHNN